MQRSMQSIGGLSFTRILPDAQQMREDEDPDKLPCFGQAQPNAEPVEPDALDQEVESLLGKPSAAAVAQKKKAKNDDSFQNLQPASQVSEELHSVEPASAKVSAIKEADLSIFQNKSSFVFE